jgi:crotonobetainyl-CoA:carnitine CoA-transferase CaiB-like acyl-CoA transferase
MGEDQGPGLPLEGMVVLDLSRMLPGAVLARQLVDLGARLIKIEEPRMGDPMRLVPPFVGGIGVGFAAMLRGAESVALDLRSQDDAKRLRALAGRADVLVESFRPGTLDRWGLGWETLSATNPRLVWCSLSSYGQSGPAADLVGHDLNFMAATGALRELDPNGVPGLQIADVAGALLAASAVLAALVDRERRGRGRYLDQPLAAAPLPFVTWAYAEASAGGLAGRPLLLAGRCPCYRTYLCGDGTQIAVAALEPKFWTGLVELLEVPELAGAGYDPGAEGAAAGERLGEAFASHDRDHWLELAAEHGLPISAVHDVPDALTAGAAAAAGLLEATPAAGGATLTTPGPFHPDLGRTPVKAIGEVGADTARVLEEFGVG